MSIVSTSCIYTVMSKPVCDSVHVATTRPLGIGGIDANEYNNQQAICGSRGKTGFGRCALVDWEDVFLCKNVRSCDCD